MKTKKITRKEVRMQLSEIINLFHRIPKAKKTKESLRKIVTKTEGDIAKEKKDSLQEMIDYLRVCTKYTIYDLEATRRENSVLRKLLKDNG